MRRWTAVSTLAAIGLAPIVTLANPADTGRVRAAIQTQIDASTEATRTKNIARYMSLIPPDLTVKHPSGTAMSRDDLRADQLQQWSVIARTISISQRIDRLQVTGNTATVWTSQRWHRLMHERKGPKLDDVVTTQKHEEHWRFVGGKWWCYDIRELGGTILVNGKPYKE